MRNRDMFRLVMKCGMVLCLWMVAVSAFAQEKAGRDYLRSGNRLYRDSMYTEAEVDYRKAIEADGRMPQAYFNLGNALLRQQKPKDAMQAYEEAVKVETNKGRLASMYHNMGVILQSQKQFGPAIECYKNALRRNPADNESRYNLVLCQHQLKNNPQAVSTARHFAYRIGAFYQTYCATYGGNNLISFGVSLGVGIPVRKSRSLINIGLQYGRIGFMGKGQIEEDYFRIGVSLSSMETWFVKPKYD